MSQTAALLPRDPPRRETVITTDQIEAFLESLADLGRAAGTIQSYRRSLLQFYQTLPPDKRVDRDALARWRDGLLGAGYTPQTANAALSAANGLLEFLGRRDLQLIGQLESTPEPQPELTRTEYLRLLSAARALGKERTYLLVKAFALTGLQVRDLTQITVEAVEHGQLLAESSGETRWVPTCLREELRSYCRRQGLTAGPMFVTRNGKPLRRTQVTGEIQSLAGTARVAPEKCNPRCLRKLYLATQEEIDRSVRQLAEQAYERMLDTEQLAAGWEEVSAGSG